MLALLIALTSFAADPVEPPPTCEAGIVVRHVPAASVDRTRLEPVDTRGVRQSAVTVLSTDAASVKVIRASRVAAR